MIRNKKIFTGGINQDDSLHLLEEAQYLRIMNGRVGVTQYGRNNRVENVPGTTAITNNKMPPYGTNMTIGSCIDIEGGRMIWFVYNSMSDHGIYCYDFAANQVYAVLYDSQVAGGLNFSKDHRIDRNARVDQGLLYWTDNYNEPKKINIDSGIKLNQPSYVTNAVPYTSLTDSYEITLIRRPPIYAPSILKQYDAVYSDNFIQYTSFEFAWQYIYFDGEISVLSELSQSSQLNAVIANVPQNYNYIQCNLSLSEKIPQTARIVRLIAINQLTNGYNVVKSYDKLIDSTPFTNHNNGSSQLSYNFYGDVLGEAIDSSTASKPFDSVPLLSKTLETATNRLFLGNNLEGYTTPTTPTSLSVSYSDAAFSMIQVDGAYDSGNPADAGRDAIIYTFQGSTTSLNSVGILVTYTTISSSHGQAFNYTHAPGETITDVINWFYTNINASTYFRCLKTSNTYNTVPANSIMVYSIYDASSMVGSFTIDPVSTGNKYFKDESTYQLGIVFYDKARRKCGVSTNNNCIAKTPLKNYTNSNLVTIKWSLSNTNAVSEIPDWAYYYSIVRTKNLKTRYFIDSYTNIATYANRNADGTYAYAGTTFSSTVAAVPINTDNLVNSGMGYTYTEGDVCVIIKSDGTRFVSPVIGVDGVYILLKPFDLGSISGAESYIYEIYTPYIKSEAEPYYEVGNMYPITNPATSGRVFSTISGSLNGDIYRVQRGIGAAVYFVEAMSPNDKYYQYWINDEGFINYVTLLGQNRNQHEIRYSNVYTPGTSNNGLSTFEALNFKTVPLGTGYISKLQLASKTTEQGVIMLSIGSLQTASCYLGEVQVVGASQNAFLAQDVSVIGTINVLKGMYGTTAPETVVEYLGVIFWYDLNNGTIVQYASNGLFPVSSFKMERLFKNYAKTYLSTSSSTLDTINGFHHIPSFVDPFHKEFSVSLPGTITDSSASVLPSYSETPSYASSIINRFDIDDNLAKTLVFNMKENKWIADFQFIAEQYDYFENRVFAFKNGALYEMNTNSSTWNTWFGTQYPTRVCWVVNKPLSGLKDMSEIIIEGSVAPNYTVAYTTLPNTQITDLISSDYTNQEGILYAPFLKDRLSPNVTGDANAKLNFGDIVISQIPLIMAEFQQYSSLNYINFVDVGFNLSRGQNFILPQ